MESLVVMLGNVCSRMFIVFFLFFKVIKFCYNFVKLFDVYLLMVFRLFAIGYFCIIGV